jgi:hypothetical protein
MNIETMDELELFQVPTQLDPICHNATRLALLIYLQGCACWVPRAEIVERWFKNGHDQLKVLVEKGYAEMRPNGTNNHLDCRISETGRRALRGYLAQMDEIVCGVRFQGGA